jgi:hypothetical protein
MLNILKMLALLILFLPGQSALAKDSLLPWREVEVVLFQERSALETEQKLEWLSAVGARILVLEVYPHSSEPNANSRIWRKELQDFHRRKYDNPNLPYWVMRRRGAEVVLPAGWRICEIERHTKSLFTFRVTQRTQSVAMQESSVLRSVWKKEQSQCALCDRIQRLVLIGRPRAELAPF